jgi:hypothetical protein
MSFLSRFRILTKILAIIVFMGCVASAIAFVGSSALKALNENADNMGAAARRSLDAARASQNVLVMNRGVPQRSGSKVRQPQRGASGDRGEREAVRIAN